MCITGVWIGFIEVSCGSSTAPYVSKETVKSGTRREELHQISALPGAIEVFM
jgi:hypothetical protein